jgi:hypothetical protein
MADARGHHPNPDFIVAQIVPFELFNREWSAVPACHSSSYLHCNLLCHSHRDGNHPRVAEPLYAFRTALRSAARRPSEMCLKQQEAGHREIHRNGNHHQGQNERTQHRVPLRNPRSQGTHARRGHGKYGQPRHDRAHMHRRYAWGVTVMYVRFISGKSPALVFHPVSKRSVGITVGSHT